ncbi:MAG: xanthine dehydrogenase molybdopterin binding subunit, partial [Pseudomonadota bacterium]
QHLVAEALGLTSKDVTVLCRRMGGGFGGKETQPALFACVASVAAAKLGVAVKLRVDRDDDMEITGKRHPYTVQYDVGFDDDGVISGLNFEFASDCGRSADLSGPVNVRTLFHADNCYWLGDVCIKSRRLKTHKSSNTAFRGFGGPQGMMGIEYVIEEIARFLSKDPVEVRFANFYGEKTNNVTPYGMLVEDNISRRVMNELLETSDYTKRRAEIRSLNQQNEIIKKGISLTPVKFGISFTATHYNQAGALVHVYKDGSVLLNHGGTEMGQGLYTKVAQVVAQELGVELSRVRSSTTDTTKVPNTSATAASAGSDLNGMAARDAAAKIRTRLIDFFLNDSGQPADLREEVVFANEEISLGGLTMSFDELVSKAYHARVQLSDTGFYKTPKIHYDPKTLQGRPFYYFCYGAAVSEVAIDTLTGESKLLRVDILHDVGKSLNPAIDLGQIEGGFLQGLGWLVSEELKWHENGKLMTHAPSTYKIPAASDWPEVFNVDIAAWSENSEDTIYRSKAVGEPPFMLAMSVFMAIKDAVASCGDYKHPAPISAPATPEQVLSSIELVRDSM